MIRNASLVAGTALAIAGSVALTGQQTPTFRGRVDLVNVDVSVLDKQNQPVRDLTAKDFTLLEDGKPQQIQAFAPIDLPAPDRSAAAWTRDVAPDVRANTDTEDHRLVVIAIDDALLPQYPAFVAGAKKAAKAVIDKLGAQDLAAVVFTNNAKRGQDLTHDRARLLAATDATESSGFQPPMTGAPDAMGLSLMTSSVDALTRLADTLAGVADRRKTVIWISVGLPFLPWEASNSVSSQKELYRRWIAAMDAMRRANVNVYAINPGGMDGIRAALGRASPMTDSSALASRSLARSDSSGSSAATYQEYLRGLASSTGGRAFTNVDDFDTSVTQILRETGSFYLLGYVSSNPSTNERLRKIQVKVNRPDSTVHYRSGYYPITPAAAALDAAEPVSPIVQAIAGLLPRREIPVAVAASAFGADADGPGAIVMAASVTPPTAPAGGVDVLFEAIGEDGKLAASQHGRATAARATPAIYEAAVRLDVPPGRYQVRVAAGSQSMGVGSVYSDVDVPDTRKEPLVWSGAIIGRTGDRHAGLGPIAPIAPVTLRTFSPRDDISVFARLYQGGASAVTAATCRTRIFDESGAAKLDLTETLSPERFGDTRAAAVLRLLPLSQLPRGRYLLSLEASIGRTVARRDIRFEVH